MAIIHQVTPEMRGFCETNGKVLPVIQTTIEDDVDIALHNRFFQAGLTPFIANVGPQGALSWKALIV